MANNTLIEKLMTESSPPGWEKWIEHRKEEGMEPEMAFAIAWSKHNKGLKPHSKKKKKTKNESVLRSIVREVISEMLQEEKWMQKAVHPSKKGEFTRKAKSHGMSVAQFAKHVLAHTEDFPEETVNQAKFAKAARKVAKS